MTGLLTHLHQRRLVGGEQVGPDQQLGSAINVSSASSKTLVVSRPSCQTLPRSAGG